ncbi:MAG: hypothetical protein AB7F75_12120 [Planctomycetota bacterium]
MPQRFVALLACLVLFAAIVWFGNDAHRVTPVSATGMLGPAGRKTPGLPNNSIADQPKDLPSGHESTSHQLATSSVPGPEGKVSHGDALPDRPHARLLIHFKLPDGQDISESRVPIGGGTTVAHSPGGTSTISKSQGGHLIEIRLKSGPRMLHSLSYINTSFTKEWDVPSETDLDLLVSGTGWKSLHLTFRLDQGEVRSATVALAFNLLPSRVFLLHFQDPGLPVSDKFQWADVTELGEDIARSLRLLDSQRILREAGIRTKWVHVKVDTDPVVEVEATGTRQLLIIPGNQELIPRVLKADIPEGGRSISVDAACDIAGSLKIVRRSPEGLPYTMSISRRGSREFVPLPMKLPPGDYTVQFHNDAASFTRDCSVYAGETTLIEVD